MDETALQADRCDTSLMVIAICLWTCLDALERIGADEVEPSHERAVRAGPGRMVPQGAKH